MPDQVIANCECDNPHCAWHDKRTTCEYAASDTAKDGRLLCGGCFCAEIETVDARKQKEA